MKVSLTCCDRNSKYVTMFHEGILVDFMTPAGIDRAGVLDALVNDVAPYDGARVKINPPLCGGWDKLIIALIEESYGIAPSFPESVCATIRDHRDARNYGDAKYFNILDKDGKLDPVRVKAIFDGTIDDKIVEVAFPTGWKEIILALLG